MGLYVKSPITDGEVDTAADVVQAIKSINGNRYPATL
jgi:hypothetical protein